MQFYKDTKPWKLGGDIVSVVDENDHLGLVVSGSEEEQKNVDLKIQQCRNSVFGLLGAGYAYKCLLSPIVQAHLWKTYNLPVLLSGLHVLPIRPTNISPMSVFQNKIFRGFLKLSKSSPVNSLYFLLGQLPVEAQLHINIFTIFHNIWNNPETTIFQLVSYILKMCATSSTTWCNHLLILAARYGLPSPLKLLEEEPPWTKSAWTCLVKTNITVYFENKMRAESLTNSKMSLLNVQLLSLSGPPHPALLNIHTTQDVKRLRPHLKFLTGDYPHGVTLSHNQSNISSACKLCDNAVDSTEHVLSVCRATADCRQRIYPELMNIVARVQPTSQLLVQHTSEQLTQFITDCTSINLPNSIRIPAHNPGISDIFRVARDWCYALHNERSRLLIKKRKQQK